MLTLGKTVGQALLKGVATARDVVVPPLCLTCDTILDEAGGCCPSCWQKIRFIAPPYCEITGKPFSHDLGKGMLSADAIADPPPYEMCRSAVLYDDRTRRLVTGLKYGDRTDLAPWMAKWMVVAGREMLVPDTIIVPVPLHPARLLQRRFNQSAELGRVIAKSTGMAFRPDWLLRVRKTRQQVGLSSSQRARNVQGSFRVPVERKPELAGKRIVLIDDVYTSGATAKAATRALKRGGAASVSVLTFARVETHGD
jgi:ComF family protein